MGARSLELFSSKHNRTSYPLCQNNIGSVDQLFNEFIECNAARCTARREDAHRIVVRALGSSRFGKELGVLGSGMPTRCGAGALRDCAHGDVPALSFCWLFPEVSEPIRGHFGVSHRVLDVLVPEVVLQRAGVVAIVGNRACRSPMPALLRDYRRCQPIVQSQRPCCSVQVSSCGLDNCAGNEVHGARYFGTAPYQASSSPARLTPSIIASRSCVNGS
jgi:hypothetical protein